jgi:signal transduction histidine kinase
MNQFEKFTKIGIFDRIFRWDSISSEMKNTITSYEEYAKSMQDVNTIINKQSIENQNLNNEIQNLQTIIRDQKYEINRLLRIVQESKSIRVESKEEIIPTVINVNQIKENLELIIYIVDVLHEFSMKLTSINLEIRVSMPSLGEYPITIPFVSKSFIAYIQNTLTIFKNHFLNFINRLENLYGESDKDKIIEFKEDFDKLNQILLINDEDHIIATLHQFINEIIRKIHSFTRIKSFTHEILKDTIRTGYDVTRLCSLNSLHNSLEIILDLEYDVSIIREFLSYNQRRNIEKEDCFLRDILMKSIVNVKEFASNQGIRFKKKNFDSMIHIYALPRDIIRAFTNILHNAIKYSNPNNYVEIIIEMDKSNEHVIIKFSDIGVPIRLEEINLGLIYQLGYRGEYSNRRKRTGTGIGLTDAKRIISDHKGEINATSNMLAYETHLSYEKPFITIFTVTLPIYIRNQ